MKTFVYSFLACALLSLAGCQHPSPPQGETPNPSKTLEPVKKGMGDLSKDLGNTSKTLQGAAAAMQTDAGGVESGIAAGDTDKALKAVQGFRNTAVLVGKEASNVDAAKNKVDSLITTLQAADLQTTELKTLYESSQSSLADTEKDFLKQKEAYDKKIAELTSARDEALNKVLLGLMVGSMILVAISIAMCVNGSPKMMVWAVAGGITLLLANTMRTHGKIFAAAGAIGLVICLGMIIYQVLRHKKAEKALEETVLSVEIAKQGMSETEKTKIFGDKALPGLLHSVQSENTRGLVEEKRLNLKKKIHNTI